MANFTLSSGKLIEQLNRIKNDFSGKKAAARLSVSPETSWWYFHEFGTAEHFDSPSFEVPPSVEVTPPEDSVNSSGYPIYPREAEAIRLPGGGVQFPDPLLVPAVGDAYTMNHPGVEAKGLVRTILPEIHEQSIEKILEALRSGEYSFDAVRTALTEKVMPEVLNLIVENIGSLLHEAQERDTPGKLMGQSPASAFEAGATITDSSG